MKLPFRYGSYVRRIGSVCGLQRLSRQNQKGGRSREYASKRKPAQYDDYRELLKDDIPRLMPLPII